MDLGQSLSRGTQGGVQLGQYFAGIQRQEQQNYRQEQLLQRQREQDTLKAFESFGDALDKRDRREQLEVELGRKEEERQYQLGQRRKAEQYGVDPLSNAVRDRERDEIILGQQQVQFGNQQEIFGRNVRNLDYDYEQQVEADKAGVGPLGNALFNRGRTLNNDAYQNQLSTQKFQVSQEKLARENALEGIENDLLGGGTVKLANFGYDSDLTPDSNSRNRIGHNNNTLVDGRSAAITKSLANRLGLEKGAVLKVATDNGSFLVTYDNTVPSKMPARFKGAGRTLPETIDLFRPEDGSNSFGGKVYGVELVRQGKSGLLGEAQDQFTAQNFAEATRQFATQGQPEQGAVNSEKTSDIEARIATIDAELEAVGNGWRPNEKAGYEDDLRRQRQELTNRITGVDSRTQQPIGDASGLSSSSSQERNKEYGVPRKDIFSFGSDKPLPQ